MRAVVLMPINIPKSASTLASNTLARWLVRKFDAELMEPRNGGAFAEGTWDLAIYVCASHSFCTEEHRDRMADVYRRSAIHVYAQNDYYIPLLPKAQRVAKATDTHCFRWATIPKQVRRPGDAYVNWNQVAWKPRHPPAPTERGLIYYGAFRQKRYDTFARFFSRELRGPATISTGTKKTRWGSSADKFKKLAPGARFVPKMTNLIDDLSAYEWGLYIEDDFSQKYFTSPATRFYEMLSAGLPMIFDRRSVPSLAVAGYDVAPYAVDDARELSDFIATRLPAKIREAQIGWRRNHLRRLHREVDAALNETLGAVLAAARRGSTRYEAVQRILQHTGGPITMTARRTKTPPAETQPPPEKAAPQRGQTKRPHRDAIADAFLYGFLSKHVKPSSAVLDLGCGTTAPIARVLSEYPRRAPQRYLGVNPGRIDAAVVGTTWAEFTKAPLSSSLKIDEEFTIVVSLTAVDDAKRADRLPLLRTIKDRLAMGGKAFVGVNGATPVDQLEKAMGQAGLEVVERFGVVADPEALKEELVPAENAVLRKLKRYFDDGVASAFMAAAHPDGAARTVWHLRHAGDESEANAPTPTGTN